MLQLLCCLQKIHGTVHKLFGDDVPSCLKTFFHDSEEGISISREWLQIMGEKIWLTLFSANFSLQKFLQTFTRNQSCLFSDRLMPTLCQNIQADKIPDWKRSSLQNMEYTSCLILTFC